MKRTRVRPRTRKKELENSIHARETRAGTKAGVLLVVLWTVPACVPHAENEELENSTHARGTRAGTKADVSTFKISKSGQVSISVVTKMDTCPDW